MFNFVLMSVVVEYLLVSSTFAYPLPHAKPGRSVDETAIANIEPRQGLLALPALALALPGMWLTYAATGVAGDVITGLANALNAEFGAFTGLPFAKDSGNCLMRVNSWGGGHCEVVVIPAEKSGNKTVTTHNDKSPPNLKWNVCTWDSAKNISGQQYFNDPGVGKYMIEWTGKDTKIIGANAGPKGAVCDAQGICNPIIHFYRNGYEVQLHTWESVYQGNNYKGQQPGLCSGGVLDQFHKGGMIMGFTCAVPCWNEGGLPADETV